MYRVDNSTAAAALPAPTAAGPNPDGFFTNGNPGGGTPATVVEGEYLNMIQEEMSAVILAAGLALDKSDRAQLLSAINLIVGLYQSSNIIYLADQKPSGTDGGTSLAGTWQTRDINTVVYDGTGAVVLATDRITLPAGTYLVQGSCSTLGGNTHKSRLRNVTDGVTLVSGTSSDTTNSGVDSAVAATHSFLNGRFVIAAAKEIELQHWLGTAVATQGLGAASGTGEVEVYSVLNFLKIG